MVCLLRTPGSVLPMTWWARSIGLQDAVLAGAVIGLGLAELWVPFESVYGAGSPTISSIGVVLCGMLLGGRRRRVETCIGVFVVWLVIGIASLGQLHALFFGQVVPFMIALYSLARHGQGRVPVRRSPQ